MGRWICGVSTNVRIELVRGETDFSTFQEREAKAMCDQFMRIEDACTIWGLSHTLFIWRYISLLIFLKVKSAINANMTMSL